MKKGILSLILALCLVPGLCSATFSQKAKSFTLANGMTFWIYERHQIPTFAGMITAKVGSVDERKGETGMAHFFEHLAFKGTPVIGSRDWEKEKSYWERIDKLGEELSAEYAKGKNADGKKMEELKAEMKKLQAETLAYVVKDEMDKIYSENGGEGLNAGTGTDTTTYMVMLPANRLELWFLMESERFKYPVLREFYSERDVIAEERRMSEDNDPMSFLYEEFMNAAFTLHPYRHSVVGYMEDIQTFTRPKALNFYKTFYVPNNLTAALVGDVKFDEIRSLAEKYFGDIPRAADPPRPDVIDPRQKGERRVTVEFDAQPYLLIGYHIPAYPDRENLVANVIGRILSRGLSSRLVRDLVTNRKLAIRISASPGGAGDRYPDLFMAYAMPRYPNTAEDVEKAVYEHLEKLKSEPVKKEELEKVINQAEAALYGGFSSNFFLAFRILDGVVIFGDIDHEFKLLDEMKKVTPEEVMAVARRIFEPANRTVGVLHKKGGQK